MAKIAYQTFNFGIDRLARIARANTIVAEYAAQGFSLTLRQLYYQHVARGLIPNNDKEYKRLGELISEGRLAGLVDWDAIVDRTRNLVSLSHWSSPGAIVESCAEQFRYDLWADQPYRPEVWIEKDALVGVIDGVCQTLDVPFFSCRGYTSQSEMHGAAMRLARYARRGQTPIIFHLGDHDPSGRDMSRDIADRLELFMGGLELRRLALNWDQIQQFSPPPNPAKITDSRAAGYIAEFGGESWELDALEPAVLAGLIQDAVLSVRDDGIWDRSIQSQDEARAQLSAISQRWDDVVELVETR